MASFETQQNHEPQRSKARPLVLPSTALPTVGPPTSSDLTVANVRQWCRYFRKCTGCTRLSDPYADQLEHKRRFVDEAIGELQAVYKERGWGRPTVRDVVASPSPMAYRSSVKLCLHEDTLGNRAIGLYRQGTHQVIDIPGCPAHVPAVERLVHRLRELRAPARFYNHKGRSFQSGRLKYLTLRHGAGATGPGEQAIIISHTGVPLDELRAWLRSAGLSRICVWHSQLTRADENQIIGRHVEHLSGPQHFKMHLGGVDHELAPMAFFQANAALASGLVAGAITFRDTTRADTLLDLYGGFGAYAFATGTTFKSAIVVDGNESAVAAANATAARVPTPRLVAYAAMCETFLEKTLVADDARRITHAVVNPPRSGLSERVIKRLVPQYLPELREINYVSCNPLALVRDLARLAALGWRVRTVTPYDMFPQTEHVEVVACLRRD